MTTIVSLITNVAVQTNQTSRILQRRQVLAVQVGKENAIKIQLQTGEAFAEREQPRIQFNE